MHAAAMLETTDGSGARTVALKVHDDSMEPLLTKGDIVFVNPASTRKPEDDILATRSDRQSASILLRQVKPIGNQCNLRTGNIQIFR